MMSDDITERVRRGATLLDQRIPGWREKISVDHLRMANCVNCVLGQLFGDFLTGRETLAIDAKAHGFQSNFPHTTAEYAALQTAWLAELSRTTDERWKDGRMREVGERDDARPSHSRNCRLDKHL